MCRRDHRDHVLNLNMNVYVCACMCVCVCMYVCMCVHVCVCVCMYVSAGRMLSCLGTATDLLDIPRQPTCMNPASYV